MRFASSTSCAAVSSLMRPISRRNSASESIEVSRSSISSESSRRRVVDQLDVRVLERAQDLVDLRRLEVELVERGRDLVVGDEAGGDAPLDQHAGLVEHEHGGWGAHVVLLFAVIRDTPFDHKLAR